VGKHFLADPSSRVILHTSAEDAGRVAQAAGVKDAGPLTSSRVHFLKTGRRARPTIASQ